MKHRSAFCSAPHSIFPGLGVLLVSFLLFSSCRVESSPAPPATTVPSGPQEIDSPAGTLAGEPHLSTAPDGDVLMSWLERSSPESKEYALKFSRREEGKWSEPVTIARRNDFFVNWADFPSVVSVNADLIFAHWLQKSANATYAYDVRISRSTDGGRTWSPAIVPHRDGTPTEHGFVSMVPNGNGVAAVWLDGRKMKDGHGGHESSGDMTLRYARIDDRGAISDEAELDDRTCECCQTGMAMTDRGPVVVYRDRSAEEIRDISLVKNHGTGWSEPSSLHDDRWKIEGCPVNGPQIDARGPAAVVAWFAVSDGKSRVNVAFSNDSGATFAKPIQIDGGHPLGRVDVVLLGDGSALAIWMEQVGTSAEVRARRVRRDGSSDPPIKLASSSPARSSGVPRMTVAAGEAYFAWTTPEQPARIRVSTLRLN